MEQVSRLFLLKITLGIVLIGISLFVFGSLISHNLDDPGFKRFVEGKVINNYFGRLKYFYIYKLMSNYTQYKFVHTY